MSCPGGYTSREGGWQQPEELRLRGELLEGPEFTVMGNHQMGLLPQWSLDRSCHLEAPKGKNEAGD